MNTQMQEEENIHVQYTIVTVTHNFITQALPAGITFL